MNIGIEIDMVVKNSIEAMKKYENIFDAKILSSIDLGEGGSTAVFKIGETTFRAIDENEENNFISPKKNGSRSVWMNIKLDNIEETCKKALEDGFTIVEPVSRASGTNFFNAVIEDSYGYIWILNQDVE